MRKLSVAMMAVWALGCGGGQPTTGPAGPSSVGPSNQDENAELRAQVERLTAEVASLRGAVAELTDRLAELDGRVGAAPAPTPLPARPRPATPDPDQVYAVPVAGSPYRGPRDAPVTMVRAFEFACPYCEKSRTTMDALIDAYPGELKIVYKHYIVHPQTATLPAQAACAAGRQGTFFEMEKLIWDEAFQTRDFGEAKLEELARRLSLDLDTWKADMAGPCKQVVQIDQTQLTAVGTRGTPSFYINGRHLSGARPVDQFKTLIDEELALARERIKGGKATIDSYYKTFVIEAGKSSVD
jgi:protein-disulfide isomerase